MRDLNEITNGLSEERLQWTIDKFREFLKECYTNEQGSFCRMIINHCETVKDSLNK